MIDTHIFFKFDNLSILDSPTKISAKWCVSKDLPYFEGHFPKNPILPAVALIDLVTELLSITLKKPVKMKAVSSAKFLEPITPKDIISIELNASTNTEAWSCLLKNQDATLVGKLSFNI
jgi:3-hydroxyacyl-[acyl-carrier-protein] dehydratase